MHLEWAAGVGRIVVEVAHLNGSHRPDDVNLNAVQITPDEGKGGKCEDLRGRSQLLRNRSQDNGLLRRLAASKRSLWVRPLCTKGHKLA